MLHIYYNKETSIVFHFGDKIENKEIFGNNVVEIYGDVGLLQQVEYDGDTEYKLPDDLASLQDLARQFITHVASNVDNGMPFDGEVYSMTDAMIYDISRRQGAIINEVDIPMTLKFANSDGVLVQFTLDKVTEFYRESQRWIEKRRSDLDNVLAITDSTQDPSEVKEMISSTGIPEALMI